MKEVKSKITKREQMSLLLEKSGWYNGRCVDISKFEEQCEEQGIELFESAKKFLEEFIGIERYIPFKYIHPNNDIGESSQDYIFGFITKPNDEIYYEEEYEEILDFAQEDCFYLGESGYYNAAVVAIGRSGKLYFNHDYDYRIQVYDNLIDSMLWELKTMDIVTSSLYK